MKERKINFWCNVSIKKLFRFVRYFDGHWWIFIIIYQDEKQERSNNNINRGTVGIVSILVIKLNSIKYLWTVLFKFHRFKELCFCCFPGKHLRLVFDICGRTATLVSSLFWPLWHVSTSITWAFFSFRNKRLTIIVFKWIWNGI